MGDGKWHISVIRDVHCLCFSTHSYGAVHVSRHKYILHTLLKEEVVFINQTLGNYSMQI